METKGRTTTTIVPKHTKRTKTMQEIEVEKEALQAQLAEIEKSENEYLEQQRAAEELANAVLESEYNETIQMAEQYEKMSLQATTEYDKKLYVKEAYRLRQQAKEIAPKTILEQEKRGFVESINQKALGILLVSFFGFLGLAWLGFDMIRTKILAYNASLTIENMSSAMQPYGLDSFQKLFFESFVTGIDLLVLFIMLYIIDRSALKYITSFIKTEKNPKQDFNELSPWQRQLKVTILLASALLYLALRHLVKA